MENDDKKHYLSKEGFLRLKEELEHIIGDKRREIAEQLEYAKSLGDLSENAEYHAAREAQASNEMRIMELEDLLRRAEIIEERPAASSSGVVEVGSRVVAKRTDLGTTHEFHLVGVEESNPSVNKISHESPIGKALMGRKKGEDANVFTPKGVASYRIMDIL